MSRIPHSVETQNFTSLRNQAFLIGIVKQDGLGDSRIPIVTDSVAAGFSAVPAGNWNNGFNNEGNNANFWSSTENSSNNAYNRNLNYNNENVNRNNNNKNNGFSVRCVRDGCDLL